MAVPPARGADHGALKQKAPKKKAPVPRFSRGVEEGERSQARSGGKANQIEGVDGLPKGEEPRLLFMNCILFSLQIVRVEG